MSTTNVARDAFDAFHTGDNSKCGQLLEQIASVKGSFDVKVAHNTCVNDYYRSGCADPQQLLTQLTQAHERAREREKKDKGRKKREDDEEETYREDDDLGVLRYNQALLCLQLRQHAQATLILEELFENIEPIDDFLAIKICFLYIELCLLQREPEQALAVLAYLEKPNAFMTVLRSERPPPKGVESAGSEGEGERPRGAAEENGAAGDGVAVEAGSEPKAASAPAAGSPPAEGAPSEAAEGPPPSLTVGAVLPRHGRAPDTISRAEYRFFCLMYRARLSVALKNTKAAKKDAKSALEVLEQELRHAPLLTTAGTAASRPGADGHSGGRSPEEALREALHRQRHAMVNVLKAYLEYTRQNVRKAMKLLTMCQFNFAEGKSGAQHGEDQTPPDFHPAQDEACAAVFFNNLGCIHFMMHKPNLAAFYFQKALQARGPATAPAGQAGLRLPGVLGTRHWLDRRAEVAYNAGLQMLMCEQPSCAFKCFEQCAPVFRTWPRLWIRLAECCIEMHRQSLTPASSSAGEVREPDGAAAAGGPAAWSRVAGRPAASSARQLLWGIQGGGAHRRWLLTTTRSPPLGRRTGGGEEEDSGANAAGKAEREGVDGERPALAGEGALTQAAMCLRNVLVLAAQMLPERGAAPPSGAADGNTEEGRQASGAGGQEKAPPGQSSSGGPRHQARDLLECEASLLEDAALVKLAYVCLCQRDHSGALRYSRRLLEKNHLLLQAAADGAARDGPQDADEAPRRQWAFQAQNLPQAAGPGAAGGAGGGLAVKCPSSVACVTLAVLYAAEALLLSGRPAEARTLLGSFVAGNAVSRGMELQSSVYSELERAAASPPVGSSGSSLRPGAEAAGAGAHDERARSMCGGLNPSAPMGGLTPPGYVLHSTGSTASQAEKEKAANSKDGGHAAIVVYPASEFPRLGETQCMLYTNLAALHVQDGNLDEAEASCEKALQVQPQALAPLRTLIYVLLRRGNHAQALRRLKQSRLQGAAR